MELHLEQAPGTSSPWGPVKRNIAVLVLQALWLTGCGPATVNTHPDATTASGGSNPQSAQIGQPITIEGNVQGSSVQVTAVRIVKKTLPTVQFSPIGKGKRLVAVQFRMVNTGTVSYADSPSNGAKVVDKAGQQFSADIMHPEVTAGPLFPALVKVSPGNKALGFLVFEVPKNAEITQVQFSMHSGFGETAQWNVP